MMIFGDLLSCHNLKGNFDVYRKDLMGLCLFIRKSTSYMFGRCIPCTHFMNIQWWHLTSPRNFSLHSFSGQRPGTWPHTQTQVWGRQEWCCGGGGRLPCQPLVHDSRSWALQWLTQTLPHHNSPLASHPHRPLGPRWCLLFHNLRAYYSPLGMSVGICST